MKVNRLDKRKGGGRGNKMKRRGGGFDVERKDKGRTEGTSRLK